MGAIVVGYVRFGRSSGPLVTAASGWVANGKVVGPTPLPRSVGALLFQALGCVCASQLAPPLQVPIAMGGEAAPAPLPPAEEGPAEPQLSPAASSSDSSSSSSSSSSSLPGGFQMRCPIDFRWKERAGKDGSVAVGVDRVTRHPQVWSLALFGLGSAIATPYAAGVAFGLGPLAFATIGFTHQDYRHRRGMGGMLSKEKDVATSNLPFRALFEGRQSWGAVADELKMTNAALALIPPLFLFARRFR